MFIVRWTAYVHLFIYFFFKYSVSLQNFEQYYYSISSYTRKCNFHERNLIPAVFI